MAFHDARLTYVEGFAFSECGRAEAGPVHHAWTVDESGKVVDRTWRDPGQEYFGVAFHGSWLVDVVVERLDGYFLNWQPVNVLMGEELVGALWDRRDMWGGTPGSEVSRDANFRHYLLQTDGLLRHLVALARDGWQGSAADLVGVLYELEPEGPWPTTPQGMTEKLKAYERQLTRHGVGVSRPEKGIWQIAAKDASVACD